MEIWSGGFCEFQTDLAPRVKNVPITWTGWSLNFQRASDVTVSFFSFITLCIWLNWVLRLSLGKCSECFRSNRCFPDSASLISLPWVPSVSPICLWTNARSLYWCSVCLCEGGRCGLEPLQILKILAEKKKSYQSKYLPLEELGSSLQPNRQLELSR